MISIMYNDFIRGMNEGILRRANKALVKDMAESFKTAMLNIYAIMHLYRGGRGLILCPYSLQGMTMEPCH